MRPILSERSVSCCHRINLKQKLRRFKRLNIFPFSLEIELTRKRLRHCLESDAEECKIYRNGEWWHEGSRHFWIGGQTEDPNRCETPFVWKTLKKKQTPFSYTKWIPGKPDCSSNEDRCVYLTADRDYSWNAMDCRIPTCTLCEI